MSDAEKTTATPTFTLDQLQNLLGQLQATQHAQALPENSIGVPVGFLKRKKKAMKVDGPYQHGRKFRIRIRDAGGTRYEVFDTAPEAEGRANRLRLQADAVSTLTVSEALEAYEEHMKGKDNDARTISVTQQRLRVFLREVLEKPIGVVRSGQELLFSLDSYRTAQNEPLAVASKRALFNQGRTFFKWAKVGGLTKANPLDDLRVEGYTKKGKPQLTADEGVKFLVTALKAADQALRGKKLPRRGSLAMPQFEGAVAAACCLWLGVRASEVADRQVRDLDCGGTVFSIPKAKTWNGIRRRPIPARLRPYLQRLAEGKEPTDRLFGETADRFAIRRWVRRLCKLAGVPVVAPHGLRGTYGTLMVESGESVGAVSRGMGHGSQAVTLGHYVLPEAVDAAAQRRVDGVFGPAVVSEVSEVSAQEFGSNLVPKRGELEASLT
jgi:integrase